ncbi:MAG: hypothetical protein WC009_02100 [Methylotenera sp.]
MEKKVYSGIVKAISDGTTYNGLYTLYSYIEMSDGTMIKKLFSMTGIDGKLNAALQSDQEVELHVAPSLTKINGSKVLLLIAIKMPDGRIYAIEPDKLSPSIMYILAIVFMGILGSIIFIGLILLWFAWNMWRQKRFADELKAYLQSLNPIFI